MTDLHNLSFFAHLLVRVLLLTGLGPGIALAIVLEKFRIVKFGFEEAASSGDRQLVRVRCRIPSSPANCLPRKIRRCA
jgi:hypothetical protein